ncbi:MAG: glycine zipper 2TM domain-containing protein [Candidatus Tectomicrobia bacterium]|nr:glycine zipper 2TM domain-containing protein [Candidatus Tectomicrobia bacterium]
MAPSVRNNQMRSVATLLIFVIVLTMSLAGCETVSEHRQTALGAGAGAAAGAVLGGLIGRNTTGVVVGGLLGALAGGAIGNYLERQDRDRTQAATEAGYQPDQGNIIRIDRVQTSPASIRPGDTVNLLATYTILTPNDQQIIVRETREVRHDGRLVANPTTEFQRTNGTFTSALPIRLPRAARPGTYDVTMTVEVGDLTSRGTSTFSVR